MKVSREVETNCLLILNSRTGERYSINGAELARRLGMRGTRNDARVVREIIHELRCKGNPIISNNDGYFLPDTWVEANRWVDKLKAHAIEEILTRRDILRGLPAYFENAKSRKMF